MLKVKKTIHTHTKTDTYAADVDDIKKAIKNLYLKNEKRNKTINNYSQLITKMRNEYATIAKENQMLKNQLEEYKNYYNSVTENNN